MCLVSFHKSLARKDRHNLYLHQHQVRHRHHGILQMYIGECDKPSFFSTHQRRCHALNFLILLALCCDLQFHEIQIFNLSGIPLGSGKRHKGCRQNQIVENLVLIWVSFWMGRSWQSYVLFHSAIWTIGQWIDPLANGALFTVGTIHSAITHRPTLARTIHQSVHCLLHICTVKYGKIYAVLTA